MKRNLENIAIVTLVVFVASLFVPLHSLAQDSTKPRIAVLGFEPVASSVEKELVEGLEAYLSGRQDFTTVDRGKVKSFITKQELKKNSKARQAIAEGEKFYRQGKAAYEVLKIEEAIGHFEASLKAFSKSLEYMESNKVLLTAYLYLGMSKILVKRKKEGESDIRKMLILDSKRDKRRLSKKFFPPDIIKTYGKLKKEVKAKANGKLVVTSNQPGSRVLVDGLRVGQVPYEALGVSEGEHTITVYKRGYQRWTRTINIKAGENKIAAKLERAVSFGTVDIDNDPFGYDRDLFKSAADSIDADIFVLAQVEESDSGTMRVFGQLYSVSSGELSRIEKLKIENAGVAKQRGFRFGKQLLRNVSSQGLVKPKLASQQSGKTKKERRKKPKKSKDGFTAIKTQDEDFSDFRDDRRSVRDGSKPFYKKWWFWAAVGGVVVAGGVGVAVFTDTFKSDSNSNVLVVDNPGVP